MDEYGAMVEWESAEGRRNILGETVVLKATKSNMKLRGTEIESPKLCYSHTNVGEMQNILLSKQAVHAP
jgi:hypothetical protein